jgi:hypothetical protein
MASRKVSKRTTFLRRGGLVIATVVGLALPSIGQAAGQNCVDVNTRSLDEFLDAQGSTIQFFPPVPDYLGWGGGDPVTFGLIDYAGLAADYLLEQGVNLGTEVRGVITECVLTDGSAQLTVALVTDNAMGFAQDVDALIANGFDFANTDTILGNKAVDIAAGEPAAVGSAEVYLSFRMSAPGDPLPDVLNVFNDRGERNQKLLHAPITLTFASVTEDDADQCLTVYQEAVTTPNAKELVYVTEDVAVAACVDD